VFPLKVVDEEKYLSKSKILPKRPKMPEMPKIPEIADILYHCCIFTSYWRTRNNKFVYYSSAIQQVNGYIVVERSRTWTCLFICIRCAAYMIKVGTALQVFYSKMLHVTCATNGLHRVAKQVRSHFSTVDKLIANVKQVFKKAPSLLQFF